MKSWMIMRAIKNLIRKVIAFLFFQVKSRQLRIIFTFSMAEIVVKINRHDKIKA